jgi:hypothetical protein
MLHDYLNSVTIPISIFSICSWTIDSTKKLKGLCRKDEENIFKVFNDTNKPE